MNTPYNLAMVLLRLFGCIAIFLAVLGIAFAAAFLFLYLLGAPDWFCQSVGTYAVQSVVAAPICFIGGCVIILFCRRLAGSIAKPCGLKEISS